MPILTNLLAVCSAKKAIVGWTTLVTKCRLPKNRTCNFHCIRLKPPLRRTMLPGNHRSYLCNTHLKLWYFLLYDFPVDGLSLSKARRGTNFNRSHHLRFSINKVLLTFLQRETSWKWAHFRARHKVCICIITMQHWLSPASFTCTTIGYLHR